MAAAAYASLLYLTSVLDELQQHPCPPVTLDKPLADFLTESLSSLQGFLEAYSGVVSKDLVSRILDAAYAAEDVIDTHIVRQSTAECFRRDLQQVALDMATVAKEAMEIREKLQLPYNQIHDTSSSVRPPFVVQQQHIMVGFDDVLKQFLDKLTGDRHSPRQTVAIVGMGGSGKTTLSKTAYQHQFIKQNFDILTWVTVSRDFNLQDILLKVVDQISDETSKLRQEELGDKMHKLLVGRRYLVVLDDIWSKEALDGVSRFFPNNNNGSRIVITTRLSTLASALSNHCIKMNFLDSETSWDLLCRILFGNEACPNELEESGRKIAENCGGLPLSIAVIGGLLATGKRELGISC